MAHNNRIRGGTDPWADILPSEIEQLEANLAAGMNGVDGSAHAPESPILIGGSGVALTGPLALARGGVLTTTSDASAEVSATVIFGDGDYPVLDPTNPFNVRPILIPCATAAGLPQFTWNVRRETGALQAYSAMFDPSDGLGPRVSRAYLRIRAHDASTLASIQVFFRVGAVHTSLPTAMPSGRVLRVDALGNCVALTSAASGADPNGYVYVPTPSSAAAWTALQGTQALTVPCDQNNVVDASNYDYVLELVEEQGLTGYPWSLLYTLPVLVATTGGNLASLSGLLSIDGITVGAGDSVLVKDQLDPTQNGVYVAASGAWSRIDWLNAGTQLVQGMVVPVVGGVGSVLNGNTFWQLKSSITSWTPAQPSATPPVVGTALTFVQKLDAQNPIEGQSFFGHGILWQDAFATFKNIPDLRPE